MSSLKHPYKLGNSDKGKLYVLACVYLKQVFLNLIFKFKT